MDKAAAHTDRTLDCSLRSCKLNCNITAKMSYSLGVYMTATFIAPLVALCVSSLGLFITVYAILAMCWPFHPKVEQCIKRKLPSYMVCEAHERAGRIPCWTFIFGGLKLIYGHQLAETKKTDGSVSYFICERRVKPWLMAMLFRTWFYVLKYGVSTCYHMLPRVTTCIFDAHDVFSNFHFWCVLFCDVLVVCNFRVNKHTLFECKQ